MIIKSFEILRNLSKLNNIGIFILYGENIGLKKDLKKEIISINSKKEKGLEVLSYTEEEVLNSKEELIFSKMILKEIKKYDVVVVSDYGHGLITPKIVDLIEKEYNLLLG